MALMVSSIFSTCPCFTPLEFARPKPSISSLPYSFLRPAMAAIFVVPMSSPTIMGCSWFMVWFNLLFVLMFTVCVCTLGFLRQIVTPEILFCQNIFFQWFHVPWSCRIGCHVTRHLNHLHHILM